jgi:5'-nucleotidase
VYYWNTPGTPDADPHPDSDEQALADGYISVTPLQFNLTRYDLLPGMAEWTWEV